MVLSITSTYTRSTSDMKYQMVEYQTSPLHHHKLHVHLEMTATRKATTTIRNAVVFLLGIVLDSALPVYVISFLLNTKKQHYQPNY